MSVECGVSKSSIWMFTGIRSLLFSLLTLSCLATIYIYYNIIDDYLYINPINTINSRWHDKPDPLLKPNLISVASEIHQKYGMVVFQVIDNNFIEMTKSWLCNIRQVSIKVLLRLIIVVTDINTYKQLKTFSNDNNISFKLLLINNSLYNNNYQYGDYEYFQMILFRLHLQNSLLQNNITVFTTESDSIWFETETEDEIINDIHNLLSKNDIVSYDDFAHFKNDSCLCCGFVAFSPSIKHLFQDFTDWYDKHLSTIALNIKNGNINHSSVGVDGNEQMVLRNWINTKKIKLAFVDVTKYSNGMWYERNTVATKDVIYVHNNFIVGTAKKIHRAKHWKHWFLSSKGQCALVTPIRHL
eukprot:502858_1